MVQAGLQVPLVLLARQVLLPTLVLLVQPDQQDTLVQLELAAPQVVPQAPLAHRVLLVQAAVQVVPQAPLVLLVLQVLQVQAARRRAQLVLLVILVPQASLVQAAVQPEPQVRLD